MSYYLHKKGIVIGFFVVNLFLMICQLIPISYVKMNWDTNYKGYIKLYFNSNNKLEPYSEKNTKLSGKKNTMFFFITEKCENNLRIDFEADEGEVYLNQIKIFKPFTTYTLENDDLKDKVIAQNGILQYKDGKYIFNHSDAFIILSSIQGRKSLNIYTIGFEFALVMIIIIAKIFGGNIVFAYNIFIRHVSVIIDYYKESRSLFFWIIFLLIMEYGFKVFNFSLSIDTEYAIISEHPTGWISQGRFVTALLILLLNLSPHVPYVSNFLAVACLGVSSFVWNYVVFGKSLKHSKVSDAVFCGIFVTCPSLAEMMAFSTYNFEVVVGLSFCGLALVFFSDWLDKREKADFVYSLFFLVMSIGIYQSMIILFVMGAFMNRLVVNEEGRDVLFEDFVKSCILCSVGSLLLYHIICKFLYKFIPRSEYLNDFVRWGKDSYDVIFKRFLEYLYNILSGGISYGMEFMTIGLIIIISYLIYELAMHREEWKKRCIYFVVILSSLFAFQLLTGGILPVRANLMITLFMAFAFTFVLLKLSAYARKTYMLCVCSCLLISFYQAYSVSFLMHGEYVKNQHEFYVMNQLASDLLQTEYEAKSKYGKNLPVAIIGIPDDNFHERAVHRGEIIGHSIMGHGQPARIYAYMRILGYDFKFCNKEDFEYVSKEYKGKLPKWPVKQSIVITEKYIIVSL